MARYLLIDVWFCARSRKHILPKRKHVHTDQNGNSHLQTNGICGKIDIHINHGFAIHSQGVELPDFTVLT